MRPKRANRSTFPTSRRQPCPTAIRKPRAVPLGTRAPTLSIPTNRTKAARSPRNWKTDRPKALSRPKTIPKTSAPKAPDAPTSPSGSTGRRWSQCASTSINHTIVEPDTLSRSFVRCTAMTSTACPRAEVARQARSEPRLTQPCGQAVPRPSARPWPRPREPRLLCRAYRRDTAANVRLSLYVRLARIENDLRSMLWMTKFSSVSGGSLRCRNAAGHARIHLTARTLRIARIDVGLRRSLSHHALIARSPSPTPRWPKGKEVGSLPTPCRPRAIILLALKACSTTWDAERPLSPAVSTAGLSFSSPGSLCAQGSFHS